MFMQFFGITLNLITLFALVLAIGVVVDDAIVVIEAVHAKMEHENLKPRKATKKAMREISGAIIDVGSVYTGSIHVRPCRFILQAVLNNYGNSHYYFGCSSTYTYSCIVRYYIEKQPW